MKIVLSFENRFKWLRSNLIQEQYRIYNKKTFIKWKLKDKKQKIFNKQQSNYDLLYIFKYRRSKRLTLSRFDLHLIKIVTFITNIFM